MRREASLEPVLVELMGLRTSEMPMDNAPHHKVVNALLYTLCESHANPRSYRKSGRKSGGNVSLALRPRSKNHGKTARCQAPSKVNCSRLSIASSSATSKSS